MAHKKKPVSLFGKQRTPPKIKRKSSKSRGQKGKTMQIKPKTKKKISAQSKVSTKLVRAQKEAKTVPSMKRVKSPRSAVAPKSFAVETTLHRTKVRIFGIGGGGCSIISEIAARVKKADFVAANTDTKALREVANQVKRFQFGQNVTHGLGTGMNPDLGFIAAQEEQEKIQKLLEGQDLCIIVACLGGGTGSGSTPIFAKIAKNLGNLTYGIFTLPFQFEGERKMEIAMDALEKIRPNLNAFSVIPNERIFRIIDKDTPLKAALSAINKRLSENLEGLIEMIYLPGLINIDFADLRTVLEGKGRVAYLNTLEVEGQETEEAIKKVILSPLYDYTIKGAKGVVYNITGGNNLHLTEVSAISEIIAGTVNKSAKIIFGITQNKKYHNKIKVTLFATGCSGKPISKKQGPTKVLSKIIRKSRKKKLREKPIPTRKMKKRKRVSSTKERLLQRKVAPILSKKRKTQEKKSKNIDQQVAVEQEKSSLPIAIPSSAKEKLQLSVIEQLPRQEKTSETPFPAETKKDEAAYTTEGSAPVNVTVQHDTAAVMPNASEQAATTGLESDVKEKVRRSALEVKKVAEKEERELMEREAAWETPAIFRKKK